MSGKPPKYNCPWCDERHAARSKPTEGFRHSKKCEKTKVAKCIDDDSNEYCPACGWWYGSPEW